MAALEKSFVPVHFIRNKDKKWILYLYLLILPKRFCALKEYKLHTLGLQNRIFL